MIRDAIASIDIKGAELIVIVSPHAEATGVYREVAGNLAAFGVGDIAIAAETDEGLVAVAAEAGRTEILGEPIDHGVTVPLLLGKWELPIVALGMEEGGDDLHDPVARIARAAESIAERTDIALLASVNLSPGLSPRAPLTGLERAQESEEQLVEMVRADVGWLEYSGAVAARAMASCGAGPLSVLGRLLRGHPAEILAHEAPVGVGYLVAQTT